MNSLVLLFLSTSALATATLSAIIGMGGGMLLLAIMLLFLPVEIAIPVHAAVQLISNAARTFVFLKHVQWKVWALFCGPAIVGVIIGRELVAALDPEFLRYFIAFFILVTTYLPKPKSGNAWPLWPFAIAGSLAGTFGMVVGATGPIIAPFFLHAKLLKEKLIATKAVCQATLHILKLIAFGTLGFQFREQLWLIGCLGVAVVLGTYIGKHVLERVSERVFVILIKVLLTLIALKLLLIG